MGWYISHGGTKHGYSYSSVADLGDELWALARWTEWRRIKVIFNRRSGDPFDISPTSAVQIGEALLKVADRLDAEWAQMARQIGNSAIRAASRREPWRWS